MDTSTLCAIIVTYHPNSSFFERVRDIESQVASVVIVDNGSDEATRSALASWAKESPNSRFVIENTVNNLAVAQNLGLKHARDRGTAWGLLLDDDSQPAADMVAQMVRAYTSSPAPDSIGLVAAHMRETHSARSTRYLLSTGQLGWAETKGDIQDNVLMVISSGSTIRLEILANIGGMDEDYVIDYIDKEFCLRLNRAGYRIVVALHASLNHHIGQSSDHRLFGLRFTATNHPPLRRYYIYRNRLRTLGRHGLRFPSFVLHEMAGIAYDLARIALFEQEKYLKFRAIAYGVRDALMGLESPRWRL